MRYFGGKSKIAKDISNYINSLITEGVNDCNTSEENKELLSISQNGSIITTHTHNMLNLFVAR